MAEQPISEWFMQEVLPLEPMLTRLLRRSRRGDAEIDLPPGNEQHEPSHFHDR